MELNKKIIEIFRNIVNKSGEIGSLFFFTGFVLVTVIIMINSRITPPQVNTSIFYINDIHGQIPKMEQLVNAAQAYDRFVKSNEGKLDSLKLSSGDTLIGENPAIGQAATEFENIIGIDVKVLGNHEFDSKSENLPKFLSLSNSVKVGTNMNFEPGSPIKPYIHSSYVKEVNGNKYGFLGIVPTDLALRVKKKETLNGVTSDDDERTLKDLQAEVNKLQERGINKIILLSHAGYDLEKKVAQRVSGIDVILGGHSHDLHKGIVNQKNFFMSPVNEPVVITQTGCNGERYGVLDVSFNEKGQIIAANNNVLETNLHEKNPAAVAKMDSYLGKSTVIGNVKYAEPFPEDQMLEENPFADFILDAIKSELDVDVVFMNSGNLRGSIPMGSVSDRDISSISPFKNFMCTAYIDQKELVQTIKNGLKAAQTVEKKPGLVQVSGLRYVATDKGELKELYFIDKNGKKKPIDFNDPDDDVKYLAAFDDFLARGNEGFDGLNKIDDDDTRKYDFDKDHCAIEYIKKMNGKPFDIKKDGRVTIIKAKNSETTPAIQPNFTYMKPSSDLRHWLQQIASHKDLSLSKAQ